MDDSKTPADPDSQPPLLPPGTPVEQRPATDGLHLSRGAAAQRAAAEDAQPLTQQEISASLTRPHRMLDVVLGERFRLSANVRTASNLRALIFALLVCSTVFSLPFALVDGPSRLLHVVVLFLGTVLLCFPSFLVFASYLGVKLHPAQSLTIALIIPAAAAVFTLGFAPIYWFLEATVPEDGGVGGPFVRIALLVLSLALGLSHVNRCLLLDAKMKALRDNWPLWVGWQLLLVLLSIRMARTLGLLS
jgi:hypothetical protein